MPFELFESGLKDILRAKHIARILKIWMHAKYVKQISDQIPKAQVCAS